MKHKININLDDPEEARAFWDKYCTSSKRQIARSLGLTGKGSENLAGNLKAYSINKHVATKQRSKGDIETALKYEAICDRIYPDIVAICECW